MFADRTPGPRRTLCATATRSMITGGCRWCKNTYLCIISQAVTWAKPSIAQTVWPSVASPTLENTLHSSLPTYITYPF